LKRSQQHTFTLFSVLLHTGEKKSVNEEKHKLVVMQKNAMKLQKLYEIRRVSRSKLRLQRYFKNTRNK
jgi:hypothetical protein